MIYNILPSLLLNTLTFREKHPVENFLTVHLSLISREIKLGELSR